MLWWTWSGSFSLDLQKITNLHENEHKYSDHLLIKLLEAGDPDHFNRQKVAPFDPNFDYDKMTEGQVRALLKWLRVRIQVAESLRAQRQPAAAKTGASKFPAVFRGDGWPYKREGTKGHCYARARRSCKGRSRRICSSQRLRRSPGREPAQTA